MTVEDKRKLSLMITGMSTIAQQMKELLTVQIEEEGDDKRFLQLVLDFMHDLYATTQPTRALPNPKAWVHPQSPANKNMYVLRFSEMPRSIKYWDYWPRIMQWLIDRHLIVREKNTHGMYTKLYFVAEDLLSAIDALREQLCELF